jgi:hypothetical protein
MISTSLGMGATLVPPRSPPGLPSLEGALDIINFHHGAVPEIVFNRVWVM